MYQKSNFPCIVECFQPPWDTEIGKAFIIHYTYGCDYDMKVIATSYDYENTNYM